MDLATLLPVLANSLTDNDPGVHRSAGWLLFKTAGLGAKSYAAVSNALSDQSPVIRAAAARVTGIYGARAKTAMPKLTGLTNETTEPNQAVRREAAETLKKIASGDSGP